MKYSRWGILAVIVLFGMLVSACGSAAQPATPAPTPIPGPALACKGDVCIRQVFATMTDDALQIAFDLSDKNSNVELGKPPEFTGDIYVSAHRLDKEGKDDFVFAVGIPQGTYGCYSGNDLPWTGGELGAMCGFALPLDEMQVQLNAEDLIRIWLVDFNFQQAVNVKKE